MASVTDNAIIFYLTADSDDFESAMVEAARAMENVRREEKRLERETKDLEKDEKSLATQTKHTTTSVKHLGKGLESAKFAAQGVGGTIGGLAGQVEAFGQSVVAAGEALGPWGVAIGAVTLAVGGLALGLAAAVGAAATLAIKSSELRSSLSDLQEFDDFQPISPEAEAASSRLSAQISLLGNIFTDVAADIGEAFAPAMSSIVDGILIAVLAFQGFEQGVLSSGNTVERVISAITLFLISFLTGPLQGFMLGVTSLGELADALGLSVGKVLLQVSNGFYGAMRSVSDLTAQAVVGLGEHALALADTATGYANLREKLVAYKKELAASPATSTAPGVGAPSSHRSGATSAVVDIPVAHLQEQAGAVQDTVISAFIPPIRQVEEEYSEVFDQIATQGLSAFSQLAAAAKGAVQARIDALKEGTVAERKAARTLFAIRKGIALSQAVMDTAAAVIGALANPGGVLGAVMSVAAGITGATQAAVIAAETPSFPFGGVIPGGADHRLVSAAPGEAILNRQAVADLGASGVESLNRGTALRQPVVVQMTYGNRSFETFIADHLKTNGALSRAINGSAKPGHFTRTK